MKLGSAFIEIRPDTDGFLGSLRTQLRAALAQISGAVQVSADAKGLRSEVARAVRAAEVGQSIDVDVRADARGAQGILAAYHETVGKAVKETALLSNTISLVKFPALIAGATQAISALGALAAGSAGLVSALAPLTGVLGAIPQAGAVAAQGLGTVTLAAFDLADAIKLLEKVDEAGAAGSERVAAAQKNLARVRAEAADQIARDGTKVAAANARIRTAEEAVVKAQDAAIKANKDIADQLGELSPATVSFARTLQNLQPRFREVKEAAAGGLFPGVEDGIKRASALLPTLQDLLRGTGEAIGDVTRRFGELVSSPAFTADIRTLGLANTEAIARAGTAALHLSDAFRNVALAALPLTDTLSRAGVRLAAYVRDAAAAGRESGRLARFFEQTVDVGRTSFSILTNVGRTFFDIGRAAAPLGRELLASLDAATRKLADFTGSTQGRNALRSFFEDARPVLHEIGLLLADIARAFGGLASNPATAGLIAQLRTQLLPVLVEIFNTTTGLFSTRFVELLTSVARIFALLATEAGALTGFLGILQSMLELFFGLIRAVPGLDSLVVTLVSLSGILRAINLLSALSGAGAFISALVGMRSAALGATGAVGGLRAALGSISGNLAVGIGVGALIAVQQGLTKAKDRAKELVAELTRDIRTNNVASYNRVLGETAEALTKARSNASNSLLNVVKGTVELVTPLKNRVADAAAAAIGLAGAQDKVGASARSLRTALGSISTTTGLTRTDVVKLADSMRIDLAEGGILASSKVVLAFDELARAAGFTSGSAATAAGQTVASLTRIKEASDDLRAGIEGSFTQASSAVQAFGGQVNVTRDQLLNFFRDQEARARDFRDNIKALVASDLDPALVAEVARAGPALGGASAAAFVEAVKAGKAGAINAARENVGLLGAEVNNLVRDQLRDTSLAGAGANIGRGLVQGIITGLRDKALRGQLAADTGNILNSIRDRARVVGEIRSPSRKFARDIGAPLIAGIAVGMREASGEVTTAMNSVIRNASRGVPRLDVPSLAGPAPQAAATAAGAAPASVASSPVVGQMIFNEKVEPLHVSAEIAWVSGVRR